MNTDISRDNVITLARRACDTLMAKFDAPKQNQNSKAKWQNACPVGSEICRRRSDEIPPS